MQRRNCKGIKILITKNTFLSKIFPRYDIKYQTVINNNKKNKINSKANNHKYNKN